MGTTNTRVIIPAAGKSSRSGLNYPKTLYRLAGVPILIRVLRLMMPYDPRPIIVINPAFEGMFREALTEFSCDAELIFQTAARGMGDALLMANNLLAPADRIILMWSDIPLMDAATVTHLLACHSAHQNVCSMATWLGKDCYTIVEREEGKLKRVLETRALGIPPAAEGERDVGLFVFTKEPMFSILKRATGISGEAEHGFLYALELLAASGARVEGYPIALDTDVLSFNTPQELALIEAKLVAA